MLRHTLDMKKGIKLVIFDPDRAAYLGSSGSGKGTADLAQHDGTTDGSGRPISCGDCGGDAFAGREEERRFIGRWEGWLLTTARAGDVAGGARREAGGGPVDAAGEEQPGE